jgi:hypothetical protein
MSMSQFVGLWGVAGEDSFQSDPPNVAIEVGQKTLIATMTDPRIESAKNGGEALVTTMTLVKGKALDKLQDSKRGIAAHAKRAGGNAHSGALGVKNIAIFFDDQSGGRSQPGVGGNCPPGGPCSIVPKRPN